MDIPLGPTFRHRSHAHLFLNYLNDLKSKQFLSEIGNSLSFLDAKVSRKDNSFITFVYPKSTFTELGTSFFSFECIKFKSNGIKTLISNTYKICSSFVNLND